MNKKTTSHTTDQPERKQYWRSLLQIEMPVCVTLARKEIPADQVIKLVPGVMVHFDMPCERPLTLEVDDTVIARGDVVKVGDKFGLKLTAIEERDERWVDIFADQKRQAQIKEKPVASSIPTASAPSNNA